jgi:hypothetical protein
MAVEDALGLFPGRLGDIAAATVIVQHYSAR